MFIHVHQVFFFFFSGITFNLMYLQCCCKARDKTGGGGGVQDSLFATASKHRLAYFHTCVLHGQSTSSHPIPISPCEPHLIIAVYLKPDTHTLTHTQWFLKKKHSCIFQQFLQFIQRQSLRRARAARGVRLPEMRLPLIKILVWGRAAFNVTQDIHALLQGQHAVAPSKLLHNHTAKSRLRFNVHFYGWTVPAFYLM